MIELSAVVKNVVAFLELRMKERATDAGLVSASVAVHAAAGGVLKEEAARSAGSGSAGLEKRAPGTLTVEGSAMPGAPTAEGATNAADWK